MNREITIEYNSEDGRTTINNIFKRHPKVFESIRRKFTIGQDRGYITALIFDDDNDKNDNAFLDLFDTIVCVNTDYTRKDDDVIRIIKLKESW